MDDDLIAFLRARLDEDETHVGRFIAEHLPSRMRREVEAKRAILDEYETAAQHPYHLPEGVAEGRDDDEREHDAAVLDVMEVVVRHLIAVYSDHPGYRAEWKP